MNYEEAELIIVQKIESEELDTFKGFDEFNDSFWSGSYDCEIELKDGNLIGFTGLVNWNFDDDKGICDVEIESISYFELYDKSGETIKNFLK